MEFTQAKNYGGPMTVVFDGGHYYFYDHYFGVVAIATRKGYDGEDDHTFNVRRCDRIEESTIKRIISKSENKYIKKTTYYEFEPVDRRYDNLNCALTIGVREYGTR